MEVVGVDAPVAGEVVVRVHLDPGLDQVSAEFIEVDDDDTGVGSTGRSEVGLDAEVDLPASPAAPAADRAASTAGFSNSAMPTM